MNILRTIPSSTYKIFAIVAAHLSLVIFNMLFLWYVVSINKDDAQIVNESGIIRGSIQKIVKQELGSINSDDDIKRVDTILLKYIFLRSEELKSAHFGGFITSAQLVDRTFGLLKQRIQLFRSEPNEQNKNELLRISQILWDQANVMVYTAQSASESNIAKAKLFMIVFVLDLLLLATIVKLVYAFANEQLAKQRDLFAKSLDSENTSVFFWDARKNAYYVSDSMKELLGIAHREYIGFEDWLTIVHPEDRDRLSSSIHEAQKSKRPFWSMQYRIVDKDGATKEIMSRGFFSYSPEGNIVELPGVHFDVTEKNKLNSLENAKGALETVNAELHYFYNMMDEYIITTHTDLNGIITYASKKFLDVYGFDSADELVGKAHSVIAGESIDKDTYGQLWKTIINGNTWHGEFCNRKKNGDPIWVEAIIAPKRDINGRIIGYQSVQFYVSDKKMLEQASITDINGIKK